MSGSSGSTPERSSANDPSANTPALFAMRRAHSLGHSEAASEAVRQCQEVLTSEVNRCPIEHLRMVLEEGKAVKLYPHQRSIVTKFRERVEAGAAGEARVNLVIRNRV